MAPHSSTRAWKTPWMQEPGRLQSMGSLRIGHDRATSLSLFIFMHWRRKWQPTPVFLPGESQGQGSLVGGRLWGHTESNTTEATQQQQQQSLVYFLDRGLKTENSVSSVYLLIMRPYLVFHLFIFLKAISCSDSDSYCNHDRRRKHTSKIIYSTLQ